MTSAELAQAQEAAHVAEMAFYNMAKAKLAQGNIMLTAEERRQWDQVDKAYTEAVKRLMTLQFGRTPTDAELTRYFHPELVGAPQRG